MTVFHLGDIDFNDGVADANGALWYIEAMEGWDSPPIRSEVLELPAQHGGVTAEGMYSPREINLRGVCKGNSSAGFYASQYYLQAQTNYLNRFTSSALYFSAEEDITRRLRVLRSGQVRTTNIGSSSFRFEIGLRADDPFKYADTEDTEGFVANTPEVLVNAGTVRTYPVITLNATGTPLITVGSQTWLGSASIPSGTVINMKERTVLNGSTDHFDKVDLTSEWLYLEPGNNTVEGNLAMTVAWRDAWL